MKWQHSARSKADYDGLQPNIRKAFNKQVHLLASNLLHPSLRAPKSTTNRKTFGKPVSTGIGGSSSLSLTIPTSSSGLCPILNKLIATSRDQFQTGAWFSFTAHYSAKKTSGSRSIPRKTGGPGATSAQNGYGEQFIEALMSSMRKCWYRRFGPRCWTIQPLWRTPSSLRNGQ